MLKPLAIVLGCLLLGGIALAAQLEFGGDQRNNLALVNDLDIASNATKSSNGPAVLPSGRFTIVQVEGHTILLDTMKGNTWRLVQDEQLEWVKIRRQANFDAPKEGSNPAPVDDPFK